jgi:putative two-component system response regulator
LSTHHPDVICFDLTKPDIDGVEVLWRLRADPATRDIPVVVVTSRPLDVADRSALRDLGADVLPKDRVSREAALAAVDTAMRLAGKAA